MARKYLEYNLEQLKQAVRTSFSISETLKKIGLKPVGGNFHSIKVKIAKLNLDISHFNKEPWNKGTLQEWSSYKNDNGRKKFLIKDRGCKCENCGLTEWLNQAIVLELHHINGNRLDNKKENLQLLCCNCHAATDNWRNKKRNGNIAQLAEATDLDKLSASEETQKVESFKFGETLSDNAGGNAEPSPKWEGVESRRRKPKYCQCCNKEISVGNSKYCSQRCYREDSKLNIPKVPEILEVFKLKRSYLAVGKYFNVSDNAVRKWVLNYGIQDMVKACSSAQTKGDESRSCEENL